MRDRLALVTAQCSRDAGLATRTVAVVVRTGRVVNEGVATVAHVCAAVCLIMQVVVIVASVVTGTVFFIALRHVVRMSSLKVARRSIRLRLVALAIVVLPISVHANEAAPGRVAGDALSVPIARRLAAAEAQFGNRVRLWLGVVKRLAFRDGRVVGFRFSAVL